MATRTATAKRLSGMTDKPKRRRTRAEMEALKAAIYRVCSEHRPLTVRQAFYRLVVQGAIEKTQRAYKNTVVRLIGEMRDAGELPFGWIVDNTRLMRKPQSYGDLAEMLARQQDFYRKDIWATQDAYVEVWCESDSAAGVLAEVTQEWDVPLMSARGFSSKTFLCQSAQALNQHSDRPIHLYYFGDYGTSGVHIDRNIRNGLDRYGAARFEFERAAVTTEQIELYDLPGTPPKSSDSRSRNFDGNAVEIEAIPPKLLRELCEKCITQHLDDDALERCWAVEEAERETLATVVANLPQP